MMKRGIRQGLASILLLTAIGFATPLAAMQFNLEGMQELQERGLKLAELADQLKRLALIGSEPRQCLEIVGAITNPNQEVRIAPCNTEHRQKWKFDEERRLVSAGGTCLDIKGNPATPGTPLKSEVCRKGERQVWRQNENGRLLNHANLCLDASDNRVAMRPCSPEAPRQRWQLID